MRLLPRAKSLGRRELLERALRVRDRIETYQAILAKGPLTVTMKRTGALHVHPLLKEEARAQALFATYWKMLGLTWDAEVDS